MEYQNHVDAVVTIFHLEVCERVMNIADLVNRSHEQISSRQGIPADIPEITKVL